MTDTVELELRDRPSPLKQLDEELANGKFDGDGLFCRMRQQNFSLFRIIDCEDEGSWRAALEAYRLLELQTNERTGAPYDTQVTLPAITNRTLDELVSVHGEHDHRVPAWMEAMEQFNPEFLRWSNRLDRQYRFTVLLMGMAEYVERSTGEFAQTIQTVADSSSMRS